LTDIPPAVRRLVYTSIPTVLHLEVLLLLRQVAPASLTADELASRVGMERGALERAMFDLMARGLLSAARGLPIAYRYGPRSPQAAVTIGQLADLYRTARLAITTLILDREHESLRLFADARKQRRR
jgi:DNA-binding IclR family transcriptional regulator